MITKETKLRVLENFYAIDYIMFGKSATQMESCCPAVLEDYMNTKGALLSVMVEMYKSIKHNPPTLQEKVDLVKLRNQAIMSAKIARENAEKLVRTPEGASDVKSRLQEAVAKDPDGSYVEDVVESLIREKGFSLAVDNLLIARTLAECNNVQLEAFDSWEGKILEDAYKMLRDGLVESAVNILNINEFII